MNKDEIVQHVREGRLDDLLGQLFNGLPTAFANVADYDAVRAQLHGALKTNPANIVLVGSGRFGYSLAPGKFGRPFDPRSDLDFVMVDADLFDKSWLELIRYDFKSLTFDTEIVTSLTEHRRNNVYWGYLEPYRLKKALSFYSKVWFPAFMKLGLLRGTAGRNVKARVYRTWDHARAYHRYSFRAVVSELPPEAQ
jgi:hypothetical protein